MPTRAAAASLERLLGTQLRARVQSRAQISANELPARLPERLVAAILGHGGDARQQLAVECSSATAAVIVGRALGGGGALELDQRLDALDDLSLGVLAYVVARALADSGTELTLRTITKTRDDLLAAVSGDDLYVTGVSLQLGGRSLDLRVWSSSPSPASYLLMER